MNRLYTVYGPLLWHVGMRVLLTALLRKEMIATCGGILALAVAAHSIPRGRRKYGVADDDGSDVTLPLAECRLHTSQRHLGLPPPILSPLNDPYVTLLKGEPRRW